MLPGTKPVPQRLKDMRGNPGQRRIRQERRPHPLPEVPEPPPHLSGLAAEEWSRVTPQLHCVGILSSLDFATLGAYCEAYMAWREATDAIRVAKLRDPENRVDARNLDGPSASKNRCPGCQQHGALCIRTRPDAGRTAAVSRGGLRASRRLRKVRGIVSMNIKAAANSTA